MCYLKVKLLIMQFTKSLRFVSSCRVLSCESNITLYIYNVCHSKHYDTEKLHLYRKVFIFNNTYNVIKEFFRVEYKKSINAEIIQPF